jgi:hypothetical protein
MTTQRWQFEAVEANGVQVLRVRRPKQRWVLSTDAPHLVREYLCLDPNNVIVGYADLAQLERARVLSLRAGLYEVAIPVPPLQAAVRSRSSGGS